MAEWVAILFHIQEVLGSNLGPEIGYPGGVDVGILGCIIIHTAYNPEDQH
jgi:hypothetical protein